jgi:hypothetical protein
MFTKGDREFQILQDLEGIKGIKPPFSIIPFKNA